jgi:hypothetical protein
LSEAKLSQSLIDNDKLNTVFHLLTASRSYGSQNGGIGFTKWEKVSDDLSIPLLADRTASPNGAQWRTKIPHTRRGWLILSVASVPEVESYGCEGQNEISSHGAAKWVSIGKNESF